MLKLKMILVCAIISLGAACATNAYNDKSPQTAVAAEQSSSETNDAAAGQESQTAALAEESTDKNRVICKRTTVTGSRFSKKVCKTWDEWRFLEEQSKQGLERTQQLGTVGTPKI